MSAALHITAATATAHVDSLAVISEGQASTKQPWFVDFHILRMGLTICTKKYWASDTSREAALYRSL
jgi:hypothetical protein